MSIGYVLIFVLEIWVGPVLSIVLAQVCEGGGMVARLLLGSSMTYEIYDVIKLTQDTVAALLLRHG
jgi:hypothetical protein